MCQSNMTALLREVAVLFAGYECSSPTAPSTIDSLISGCPLAQTVLFGDPYSVVSEFLVYDWRQKKITGARCHPLACPNLLFIYLFIFIFFTLLPSSFWTALVTGVVPFFPAVLAFNFYRAEGSAIPLLVDLSSSVANSRSRVFRKSICAQEKVPTNLYDYALGGARTHETDPYQARG